MFASGKERRSWDELTTKEILTQLFVLGLTTTPLVVGAIYKLLFEGNGIEWFNLGFTGFVLFGVGSSCTGSHWRTEATTKAARSKIT